MAHRKPPEDKDTKDVKVGEEVVDPVGDYPARPYLDAVTEEHRKVLEDAHQLPKE